MSYELVITRKAAGELLRLDFWLQEEVLDELEELIEDPPAAAGIRPYRMLRLRGDDVELVFLRLHIDPVHSVIRVLDINTNPERT